MSHSQFNLEQILTTRRIYNDACFQIVYEWEDVLSKVLNKPLVDDAYASNRVFRALHRIFPTLMQIGKPKTTSLAFEMSPFLEPGNYSCHVIPCIIDFFLNEKTQLRHFYHAYKHNPTILISSKEAFEFLKQNNCPLNIFHWPLSVPDKWASKESLASPKKYDVALMGRVNPVLRKFLEQYLAAHPNVSCLTRSKIGDTFVYRSNSDDRTYPAKTREDYMNVVRMARSALYATPGLDNAKTEANGFNQVTPRFLELIASGCHVLARYPKNSDTDFFELNKFSPSIETYKQFEQAMDCARNTPIDTALYSSYIQRHTTSARARQLLEILSHA